MSLVLLVAHKEKMALDVSKFISIKYNYILSVSDCWLHFLCKNITVREANGVKDIINENTRPNSKVISQADFSWIRSAYCMKIQPPNETISWPQVTLLVFGQVGKVDEVFNKFDALSSYTPATAILKDPYCLFDVIFEVLYTRIDGLAWSLADVYGQKEEVNSNYPNWNLN